MDFINSMKAHLYEKTTSPLFGAFVVSWALINYKLLIILGSDMKAQDKFEYIETVLYVGKLAYFLMGFVYPFIFSVLLILAYPWPARKIYIYWKTQSIRQNNERLLLEGEALISKKKESEIKKISVVNELEFEKELEKKEEKIETLEVIISDLRTTNDKNETRIRELSDYVEAHKKQNPDFAKETMNKLKHTLSQNSEAEGVTYKENKIKYKNGIAMDKAQLSLLKYISLHEADKLIDLIELSKHIGTDERDNIDSLVTEKLISINKDDTVHTTKKGRNILKQPATEKYFEERIRSNADDDSDEFF